MIRVSQIKLKPNESEDILKNKICKILKVADNDIVEFEIQKKSIDARKDDVNFIYSLNVEVKREKEVLKKTKNPNVQTVQKEKYSFSTPYKSENRPVIIGAGPAGLFCGLILAENGAKPLIIERGKKVEERINDVDLFWKERILNTESNIQFGEGGAGTFSDGKLNTLIKDRDGRGLKILGEMVEGGAPKEILYFSKPHVGTDKLRKVVINLRKKIESLGGEFRFSEKMLDLKTESGKIVSVVTDKEEYTSDAVIIAIGHSARDTFEMLNKHIDIIPKPFSVGVRIEHLRKDIDKSQYGLALDKYELPAADYKLVHHCKNGRSVYTFCMCPGGVVTGSSSEKESVVTNGMSYYARNLDNSNSAVLVGVTPEDFGSDYPLAGIEFQRIIEKKAFELGGSNYNAPVQTFEDFKQGKASSEEGEIKATYQPGIAFSNLWECFPDYIVQSLIEGIEAFGQKIKGFNRKDALLTGVETRSSSPVRLVRNEEMISSIMGVYPIGEGAGYAGGIMSSAIDGIKCAEIILRNQI
jgi:hypothetical protein